MNKHNIFALALSTFIFFNSIYSDSIKNQLFDWKHIEVQGDDSSTGSFESDKFKIEIEYDIGIFADNYAESRWNGTQPHQRIIIENENETYIQVITTDNYLYITFPHEGPANYYTKLKNEKDSAIIVETLLKYRKKLHGFKKENKSKMYLNSELFQKASFGNQLFMCMLSQRYYNNKKYINAYSWFKAVQSINPNIVQFSNLSIDFLEQELSKGDIIVSQKLTKDILKLIKLTKSVSREQIITSGQITKLTGTLLCTRGIIEFEVKEKEILRLSDEIETDERSKATIQSSNFNIYLNENSCLAFLNKKEDRLDIETYDGTVQIQTIDKTKSSIIIIHTEFGSIISANPDFKISTIFSNDFEKVILKNQKSQAMEFKYQVNGKIKVLTLKKNRTYELMENKSNQISIKDITSF